MGLRRIWTRGLKSANKFMLGVASPTTVKLAESSATKQKNSRDGPVKDLKKFFLLLFVLHFVTSSPYQNIIFLYGWLKQNNRCKKLEQCTLYYFSCATCHPCCVHTWSELNSISVIMPPYTLSKRNTSACLINSIILDYMLCRRYHSFAMHR